LAFIKPILMMKILVLLAGMLLAVQGAVATPVEEGVTGLIGDIRSVKLYRMPDQTSFPLITLNGNDVLELHFDDLEGGVKNFYYSFQLCNADWTPSILQPFEYTRGFQNVRLNNYRISSLTSSRYTHYSAFVPDRNCQPTRSGNYLLRVFINGDTSKLAFTRRFVVTDRQAPVSVQVQQAFNARFFRTHHKLNIVVTPQGNNRLTNFSPQDLKVVVLQNNNWTTAYAINQPTIYRGNYFEYSDEAVTAMPAGMEWRWVDLRSLRLMSDRVERIDTKRDTTQVYLRAEPPRNGQMRVFYRDMNGSYTMENMEGNNPLWQSEYGLVHFTFVPPGNKPLEGQDVYVFGELSDFAAGGKGLMTFNEEKGIYEASLLLKQGFYNYNYVTMPRGRQGFPDYSQTEGNNWATENSYIVLIYFRPFGARADELVGSAVVNSIFSQEQRR